MVGDALRGAVAPVLRHPDAFDLAIEQQHTAELAAWSTLIADLEATFEHAPIVFVADELNRSQLCLT